MSESRIYLASSASSARENSPLGKQRTTSSTARKLRLKRNAWPRCVKGPRTPAHGESHTNAAELPKIHETLAPLMKKARQCADIVETRCADADWELPRYRDML
jgi:glutamine synthetase type III